MKRLFLIIAIILMAITPASAQLSLYSINSDLHANYSTTTTTQAWVTANFLSTASLTPYRLVADSYSTSEVDTLLNAKLSTVTAASTYATIASLADYATTGAVALKLDASAISAYYTSSQVDALLTDKADTAAVALKLDTATATADYATTGSVALKANSADVYTTAAVDLLLADKADTASVSVKIGRTDIFTAALDGTVPHPILSPSGTLVLCDDGVWRGVASVGGGVTNAVDLNASVTSFSRIMESTATNAQIAFNQIDQNAATTAEVAVLNISDDSQDVLLNTLNIAKGSNETTLASHDHSILNLQAAIGSVNTNQTVSVTAGEDLTAGDVVSLINSYGTVTAKKNNLTVNTSPNGAESVFASATTKGCSAVALDATRFLVTYAKNADGRAYGIVGTVSGSSIAWGSESASFRNTTISLTSSCLIDIDKVFCAFNDDSSSNLWGVVLSISVNAVTVGTSYTIDGNDTSPSFSVSKLDTDKAIVAYKRAISPNTNGFAKVVSVTDTTPSYGTAAEFNAATTSYISVSALSATSAIVAYQDGGNSNYGTAQVLSISGTTITPGTEYVFKAAGITYTEICSLTSTTAAIVCNSSGGFAYVATNSSGELTFGAEATFTGSSYVKNSPIDATHFLIATKVVSPSDLGMSYVGTVSGTSIAVSSGSTYNATSLAYNSACYLGSNKSVIIYSDQGNSSYGTAVVNTWAASDYSAVRGIATANITSGNSGTILLSGSFNGLTSLVTGSQYWVSSDYSLSTAPVSLAIMKNSSVQTGEIYFGTAKSATEIYVDVDYR